MKKLIIKKQKGSIKSSKRILVLREKARKKYRELWDEEKYIKKEYGRNRYLNVSEGKKQRLKEYQKNYREASKNKKSWFLVYSILI